MGNKEMSDLEKELLDSAAKLDSSKVEPDELEKSTGGCCCGGECFLLSSWCHISLGYYKCETTCIDKSPT